MNAGAAHTLIRVAELAHEIQERERQLDQEILSAVLLGASLRRVAEAAGVSRSTMHRRLSGLRVVAEVEPIALEDLDALLADALQKVGLAE